MFLTNFTKAYPKVKLKIEELHTEAIIEKLQDGHLDAAIAATPLQQEELKEKPLYYEPFVAYIPPNHRLAETDRLKVEDLDIDDILLLEDGHCFKEGIINLCKSQKKIEDTRFHLESGSFETLIKLANENLGMTLLPYLHTLDIKKEFKDNLHRFEDPVPAREVSLIFNKSELKMQIIDVLDKSISGVIKGAIAFQNVNIISPLKKEA